jgi:hypothetical protein
VAIFDDVDAPAIGRIPWCCPNKNPGFAPI